MGTASISKQIIPLLKNQGVIKAAFFGSFARGESTKRSDIDILVKFKKTVSLLDLVQLKQSLEDKIGKKIDIVTYDSIHPSLRKNILGEQKIFYEKRP